jgi:hypothetical protein
MSHMNNGISQTNRTINSDNKSRPPIKNNLNEQLKIYYTYRDGLSRDRQNNADSKENQPLSQ